MTPNRDERGRTDPFSAEPASQLVRTNTGLRRSADERSTRAFEVTAVRGTAYGLDDRARRDGVFMTTLDSLVVAIALPVLRVSLHAGLSGLEWTVNAYLLSLACLRLNGAALGDRFGRRWMCPLVTTACG